MFALAAAVAVQEPDRGRDRADGAASAAGTAERPATMALLPRLVGESRAGTGQRAPPHRAGGWASSSARRSARSSSPWPPPPSPSSVNGFTFVVSAAAHLDPATARPATREWAGDGRGVASSGRASRLVVDAPLSWCPFFVIVAMVELTYGAQTVQLVLYAEQVARSRRRGVRLPPGRRRPRRPAERARQRPAVDEPRVSGIVVGTGSGLLRDAAGVRGVGGVAVALVVTLIGGIGLVACEVVAETTLARVVPGRRAGSGHGDLRLARGRGHGPRRRCSRRS